MLVKTKNRQVRADFNLDKNKLFSAIGEQEPKATWNTIKITWAKAKDFSVFDEQGNKWIDLTSGIFVTNAGHANPAIKAAIKKQVDSDLLFSYNYPTAIKEKFLSTFLKLAPTYLNGVALLNTGSEAVDLAFKIIKLYGKSTQKKYIITFTGGYHGRGLSNDLLCGSKEKATKWSGISDPNIQFLNFPYDENTKFDPSLLPPANEIAAFMLETFQGWGAWFYPKQFIQDLYSFAKQHKALVCFDEMQAGFYRLGELFGYMTYGEEIEPDLICVGKAIAGSLPLSAVMSRKELLDLDSSADMHGTQSSNPVCLAAALANIQFLSKNIQKFRKTMKVFESEVRSLGKSKLIKTINVRGMIAGIIFDEASVATKIVKDCIYKGVLPVCTNRNSIKLAPPLTITIPAVKEAIQVLREAIARAEKEQEHHNINNSF